MFDFDGVLCKARSAIAPPGVGALESEESGARLARIIDDRMRVWCDYTLAVMRSVLQEYDRHLSDTRTPPPAPPESGQ